ncbi:zinc-dependent alcohol dehydrogenase [Kocuria dechangensis]|uniref:zinc-dependent alcohol dehydrogenase n=1 Tax=Kocuria dechangensis TaxID=1176249 RepID=UPI00166898FE|nr:alcohol dehydrogenase catalytic domain-containing protein [Kocuria dechangensis]
MALRPTAVGICGSDIHYFHGDIGALTGESDWYPRIPGHEVSGIIESIGPDVTDERLRPGALVAVWPLETCGRCYPCLRGKENACSAIRILGVHRDGGMATRVLASASSVFPVQDLPPESAAFVEPMSVAIHALSQAGLREGRAEGVHLLVLGGGPIGQAALLAATTWGATVAVLDPKPDRWATAERLGAVLALDPEAPDTITRIRGWGEGVGPDIVVDTTGVPSVLQLAAELVAPTGTVVAVGLTGRSAPFSPGILPEKEITVVGSSCAARADFAAAVRLVHSRPDAVASLISHVLPLHRVAEAFDLAQRSDAGTMKVMVSVP